jgi:hypothetical protein
MGDRFVRPSADAIGRPCAAACWTTAAMITAASIRIIDFRSAFIFSSFSSPSGKVWRQLPLDSDPSQDLGRYPRNRRISITRPDLDSILSISSKKANQEIPDFYS